MHHGEENRPMNIAECIALYFVKIGLKDVLFLDRSACDALFVAAGRDRSGLIEDYHDLKVKLASILRAKKPLLIDMNMKGFNDCQPRGGRKNPSDHQHSLWPRDEFRKNMIIDSLRSSGNPSYP